MEQINGMSIHENFHKLLRMAAVEATGSTDTPIVKPGGLELVSAYSIKHGSSFLSIHSFVLYWQKQVGLPATQGIMVKAGRSYLKTVIREHPEDTGLFDLDFRMLPKPLRLLEGLRKLNHFFFEPDLIPLTITEEDDSWRLEIQFMEGYIVQDVDMMDSLARFTTGMLQEFMMWSTGGKYYPVYQQERVYGSKSPVVFRIDKKYIS